MKKLTYENLDPLAKKIALDIEKATGLLVIYLPKIRSLVALAPKKKTKIVMESFDFFIEDGEVTFEYWTPGTRQWLLDLVKKSYKKNRKMI